MKENSVLITPHRFTPYYTQTKRAGIYCVQFVTFKNNRQGLAVLNWWREACIKWCFARVEHGKFGDQKYLDDWPVRFNGVYVENHHGAGVAPWNVQQYEILHQDQAFYVIHKKSKQKFPIIFFHAHNIRFYQPNWVDLGWYLLSDNVKKMIYIPYINKLNKTEKQLDIQFLEFNIRQPQLSLIGKIKRVCQFNIYQLK